MTMLLFINGRLIDLKEDFIEEIYIRDKKSGNPTYKLYRESKGYIFRDPVGNPYRPHFKTVGMAINNALSNDEDVYQRGKRIPSLILRSNINPIIKMHGNFKENF